MKYTFSITAKHQLKSFRAGLIILLLLPIALIFLHITHKITLDDYPVIIYLFLAFYLLLCLPAIYLHIHYYIVNRKIVLTLDTTEKQIAIDNNGTESFGFDEIRTIEQHLGIYYKNRHDNRARLKTSWSNYGYIKLNLKNGKSFFFSSLMLDPLSFPIKADSTMYRFVPYFDMEEVSFKEKRNWAEMEKQEKINEYINKFSQLPTEALEEKLTDSKRYQPEAIEATNKILKERQSGN